MKLPTAQSARLRFRDQALADVEAAARWYAEQAGGKVAGRFLVALEDAYAHIARHPGTGSARWGHALNLPGLRHWPLAHFPQLVFFTENPEYIEILRVLHGSRDIPASLAEPDGS